MSDFEAFDAKDTAATSQWVTAADVCDGGMTYTESLPSPANENVTAMHFHMTSQLPEEIQAAIGEWAAHLRTLPWKLRRRAIKRFAGCFADNFLAAMPNLTDEEYESLSDIGTTCILEQLDDGGPITDTHQARCYLDSVHDHHRAMAQSYLATTRPKAATVH